MSTLNFERTKRHLNAFDWPTLFIEELGWLAPRREDERPFTLEAQGNAYALRQVAHLGGVVAFEVESPEGRIPDAKARQALHRAVESRYREHLLLFVDGERKQTVWSYPKYDGKTLRVRSHHFVKGQPADLFLSKLVGITFDLGDLDEAGNASLLDVTQRLREALDVDRVTRKFYDAFKEQQKSLAEDHIRGIEDDETKRHYASVLLTRLMFVYFLQKKYFLDPKLGGGSDLRVRERYLQIKQKEHEGHVERTGEQISFYEWFLKPLFFQGFATHKEDRSDETNRLLGEVRYLNGGLFLPHPIENPEDHPNLDVDDSAIDGILDVFTRFEWHLDDTPGGKSDEINPDVLGYILEKYVNQKEFGAYYTRPEITAYLCDATIDRYILDAIVGSPETSDLLGLPARRFDTLAELLTSLTDPLARELLAVMQRLTVIDPAVGSGAFLVASLKKLLTIYRALVGHAELSKDKNLKNWLHKATHDRDGKKRSPSYYLKREIITRNLYGVDLLPEAVEIAKLRLFLALVASADTVDDLEPLPNIDFNLLQGNALIGLLKVDEETFVGKGGMQGDLYGYPTFISNRDEKNRLVKQYRQFAEDPLDPSDESGRLLSIRRQINEAREQAQRELNQVLSDEFGRLGAKVGMATWDDGEVTRKNRPVLVSDVDDLTPFHWAYEFSEVLDRGGFDVIVTNPPWDAFKPDDKEWFAPYDPEVTKNTMTKKVFEARKHKLLSERPDVRKAYEAYLSEFPHQNAYFRSSDDYANQETIVNGKKKTTDLNLYKLFLERCFRLLHDRGHCGIVIPAGIYGDLGTKGLREMLFEGSEVTGLFGFENKKGIFEDVHRSFKFVILTFEKGGSTEAFPATFMRHDVQELARFPDEGGIRLRVDTVKRLAPTSWAVMEITNDMDRQIVERMAEHPLIGGGEDTPRWFKLGREFHMSGDDNLYKPFEPGRLPLIEGKLIHQFNPYYEEPNAWLDEDEARAVLARKRRYRLSRAAKKAGLPVPDEHPEFQFDYTSYRLGFRDVARTTDERTMISAVLPQRVFCPHTMTLDVVYREVVEDGQLVFNHQDLSNLQRLYLAALFNSFVVDSWLRRSVTTHVSFFLVDALPAPRLTPADPRFQPIVERSARLSCFRPEFDELAREAGIGNHENAATDPREREQLRAELDGLVAHLYGLSEEEFAHLLFDEGVTGFSRVPRAVRVDAQNAYRDIARDRIESGRKVDDPEAVRLATEGESDRVEFKSTLRRNLHTGQNDPKMEEAVLKTLAAFLNTEGGTLLIGVKDDGTPLGLEADTFPNEDKLLLHLTNLVRDRMTPLALRRLELRPVWLRGKRVLKVTARPASEPMYVRDKSGSESFYVRTGPSTTALSHSDTVAYVRQHYKD